MKPCAEAFFPATCSSFHLPRQTCSILVDLTTQNFKSSHVQKSWQKKSAHAGTSDATWFCLRAATGDRRSGQQQNFRYAGKRAENGRAGQHANRSVAARFAHPHECAGRTRASEKRST